MPVTEILALLPEAEPVLAEYGLHCFHCSFNASETLEEGYLSHGYPITQLKLLVKDLNHLLKSGPKRPQTITVTREAALHLKEIATAEGHADDVLQVGVDETGGFCMEFRSESEPESSVFFHREVPELRVAATSLTLKRIGGSTIDFRDGRFKLDLMEDAKQSSCACGGKGECECGGGGACGC